MKILVILALLSMAAPPLRAESRDPALDDADISGKPLSAEERRRLDSEARLEPETRVFPLRQHARPRPLDQASGLQGAVLLPDRSGALKPARLARVRLMGPGTSVSWIPVDAGGRFHFPVSSSLSGIFRLRLSLDNDYWLLRHPKDSRAYDWESAPFELKAGAGLDLGTLSPAPDSESAKAGLIHLTYLEALAYLAREADIAWWRRATTVYWPDSADYFSPGDRSLHLSRAEAWDVILHELGHAVMNGAMRAAPAGGQHKIDECYNEALAWSEGWATFFAAAVRLSPDDPDAKFEFLVPRRAPIRIENVPQDVCKGEANEWRVSAGLWDLLDRHPDGGDSFSMPMGPLWRAITGGYTKSLSSAWALISQGLPGPERHAAESALIHNSLLPPRPALAPALPRLPPDWATPPVLAQGSGRERGSRTWNREPRPSSLSTRTSPP